MARSDGGPEAGFSTRTRGVVVLTPNASEKGGTNLVVANLVRHLEMRMPVSLVALEGGRSAYELPEGVQVVSLQPRAATRAGRMANTLSVLPRLATLLRRKRPAVVMSFLARANLANVAAQRLFRLRHASVVCERGFNSIQYGASLGGRGMLFLTGALYPKADIVVANAKELADDLHHTFGVSRERLRVIPNPVDVERIRALACEDVPEAWFSDGVPTILTVGRLIVPKNQDLLLRSFARVRAERRCRLVMIGEGPCRAELTLLARRLGVADDVAIAGWRDNPYAYMRRATVFALTSNCEGFPNALVEAMACGTPVVSTRCPSGPAEILDDGKYGVLVPVGDEGALATQLARLIGDAEAREAMGACGVSRARVFSAASMASVFGELLEGIGEVIGRVREQSGARLQLRPKEAE